MLLIGKKKEFIGNPLENDAYCQEAALLVVLSHFSYRMQIAFPRIAVLGQLLDRNRYHIIDEKTTLGSRMAELLPGNFFGINALLDRRACPIAQMLDFQPLYEKPLFPLYGRRDPHKRQYADRDKHQSNDQFKQEERTGADFFHQRPFKVVTDLLQT
jgi:hypothetical protein